MDRQLALLSAKLSLTFLGLIAVIPFVQPIHNLPLTSFYSEWTAFALVAFACLPLTTSAFWEKAAAPKVVLPTLALAAFFGIQHQFVSHVYANQAWAPAIYLVCATLVAVLASWLRDRLGAEYVLRTFAWFCLCGGVLHALLGIAQYLDLPGYLAAWLNVNLTGTALRGNVGQSNHYATQLTLASIALIYLFANGRLSAAFTYATVVLFVFVLTLTTSRAVALYLIGIAVLSALCYWCSRQRTEMLLLMPSALLLGAFALAQFLLPPFSQWLSDVLANLGFARTKLGLLTALGKTAASGVELRISEWHKAWDMFLQSPIWGIGMGNYGWHSFMLQTSPEFMTIDKPELFHHSHNLFTQFLAETGIVGFLLLIALLVFWFKQYLSYWSTHRGWFVGACLLVLFIHSNLEFPLWYSYFLFIAAFLLGVGDTRTISIRFSPFLGRITSGAGLLLVTAILVFTFTGYRTIANVNAIIYRTSPEHASRVLQLASRNPLLTPWAEQVMATHGVPSTNVTVGQLQLITRVMKYNPNPIRVGREIEYLARAGMVESADSLLNKAAVAYPSHIVSYICAWNGIKDDGVREILRRARPLAHETPYCEDSRAEPQTTSIDQGNKLH